MSRLCSCLALRAITCLFVLLVVSTARAVDDYQLGPDSQRHDGVPARQGD